LVSAYARSRTLARPRGRAVATPAGPGSALPEGWVEKDQDGLRALVAPAPKGQLLMVLVSPSFALGAQGAEADLRRFADAAERGAKSSQRTEPKRAEKDGISWSFT
jgi:hypothetical protein